MENIQEILDKLRTIKDNVNFASNRNDARKAYKLLTENKINLDVEQLVLEEQIFRIERILLTEEDRIVACKAFIISLIKIINTIDYNINGKNYKG